MIDKVFKCGLCSQLFNPMEDIIRGGILYKCKCREFYLSYLIKRVGLNPYSKRYISPFLSFMSITKPYKNPPIRDIKGKLISE